MQTTPSTYLRRKFGTHLVAAALALAGSGMMVGGNLGIAEHYAAHAGTEHATVAARAAAPRQIAGNSCAKSES